jgi:outer membrane protein assembly factor BamB
MGTDRAASRATLAVLVGVVALAGCGSIQGEAMPEVPVWAHRPGGALQIDYRRQLTNKAAITDEPYERGKPAIDARNLRLFVPSQDGGLYAVDARTGNVRWRYATRGPVQCEPLYVVEEDAVYFGSSDGALYKIAASDGTLAWRFSTNAEVARVPVIEGDSVYFANANDTIFAIDRATGKLRFYQHRTPAFGIEISGHAGVAVGHGKLFTTFSDGVAMAYSTKDGAEAWPTIDLALDAQGADGQPPQYLDADATPVLTRVKDADAVLVAHYEGGLYALEVDSGRTLWRNDRVRGATSLLVWTQPSHVENDAVIPARRILVAASGRSGLWGLDPETGEELWRRKLPEGGITEPVAVSGGLIAGTTRYGLFLFDPVTGGTIDGVAPGNEFAMAPAAHGQHAFALTNTGQLLGLVVRPPPFAAKRLKSAKSR